MTITTADRSARAEHATASLMLVLASALWGFSFPVMRALGLAQGARLAGADSWFVSAWSLALRFLIAAAILACWYRGALRGLRAPELAQALGLGLSTAAGMLLQMDGLSYTSASTSAFITASYCVFVPVVIALQDRRMPRWPALFACVLVMAGIGVLAHLDPSDLRLGRGELETLLGSLSFTVQIIWAGRPAYAANRAGPVCALAYALAGACFLPVALATMPRAGALIDAYAAPADLACLAVLTIFPTLIATGLMFAYQRRISAVTATVIYCTEPVFASLYAFVLPGLLSRWLGVTYGDEHVTGALLIGGTLVIAANLVVQLERPREAGKPGTARAEGDAAR